MNPVKMAIVFTIITIPFYFIIFEKTTSEHELKKYENNYINGVNNAIYDAKFTMNKSILNSVADSDENELHINKDEVIESFLNSYYMYFNVQDDVNKALLRSSILAIVLVDYDGFYIYGATDKGTHIDHAISEKFPYKYERDSKYYYFNLGEVVKEVDFNTNEICYKRLGFLFDDTNYDDDALTKSRAINDSIIKRLKETVIHHKKLGKFIGSTFDYYLPIAQDGSIARQINTVGLITIVEGRGYPKANEIIKVHYTEADVKKQAEVYCFKEDNVKYYSEQKSDIVGEYFIVHSKKEASQFGYLPYSNYVLPKSKP